MGFMGPSTTGLLGFTGAMGPTGPTGQGVTGPAGPAGGSAVVRSGYIQLAFSGTTFNTTPGTYDITTNFPSSIGTWAVTSSTVLTLTLTNTTATLLTPTNFTGIVNWYNGSTYRGSMISPASINSGPFIGFTYTPINPNPEVPPFTWTMTYSITSSSFPGAANNGAYGFILEMSMII
jgi:hypothetical protein